MTNSERATVSLATMAGTLALVLLILALVSQGSHQVFQINRPAADYAKLLLHRSATLKAELGIDFIFVCVYGATFIALATTLSEWARGRGDSAFSAVFGWGGAAALVVTALLDAIENAHILSLLAMAEQGQLIAQSSIATQMAASQVKFVASYFGLFLLSFALPAESRVEKLLVFSLRWLQLPLGVSIFVVPPDFVKPLSVARAIFFVAGFWMTAYMVQARGRRRSE